ncbi:MAG: hypothetical protein AB1405_15360 [Bdellovibrionota bacterium]
MNLPKTVLLFAGFLLGGILLSCGSANVPVQITFVDTTADGASQLNPLEIETSNGIDGRGSVHLQATASESFEGEIGFLNIIDAALSVPPEGVLFHRTDPNATESDNDDEGPYELLPLESVRFYVIINPTDCTATAPEAKKITVSVGPNGESATAFVDVWVRTASPVPCP